MKQAADNGFGHWSEDDQGLPCFDLVSDRQAPYHPFSHLMSTGRISLLADRWGNLNLLTSEGGTVSLSPATTHTRSGMYLLLETDRGLVSLLHSELLHTGLRYGIGYIVYEGEMTDGDRKLRVTQKFMTPADASTGFDGIFTLENTGDAPVSGRLCIGSDIFPQPVYTYSDWAKMRTNANGPGFSSFLNIYEPLGDLVLVGSREWEGAVEGPSLRLQKSIVLEPGQSLIFNCYLGYGSADEAPRLQETRLNAKPESVHDSWKRKLDRVTVSAPEPWMERESVWSVGQLFSFVHYDHYVREHFVGLGGYGFMEDPNHPGGFGGFAVREPCETAIPLSHWAPELAKSSLRWVASLQLINGDIPKVHHFRELAGPPPSGFESDTEIWFIMGCAYYVGRTGDKAILDERLAYRDGKEERLWAHLKRAFDWILHRIGLGRHGLILMRDCDWNDYLSFIGHRGRGESVMNSGMACYAFSLLADLARERGDDEFAARAEEAAVRLREAVGRTFDREWFVGAYTDDHAPVGSHADNRLFLNAQTWAVLGKCGTREQRVAALRSALVKCRTGIGLTLMSRPFSSPAPAEISWCPIPAGEGENAGIWPQTVYWFIWALAEEGLLQEALAEWQSMSMHNHAERFQEVPFGIINGPDCYSSKHAGGREGWTQVQVFNRMLAIPMNPMVAWQAFALHQINASQKRLEALNGQNMTS